MYSLLLGMSLLVACQEPAREIETPIAAMAAPTGTWLNRACLTKIPGDTLFQRQPLFLLFRPDGTMRWAKLFVNGVEQTMSWNEQNGRWQLRGDSLLCSPEQGAADDWTLSYPQSDQMRLVSSKRRTSYEEHYSRLPEKSTLDTALLRTFWSDGATYRFHLDSLYPQSRFAQSSLRLVRNRYHFTDMPLKQQKPLYADVLTWEGKTVLMLDGLSAPLESWDMVEVDALTEKELTGHFYVHNERREIRIAKE